MTYRSLLALSCMVAMVGGAVACGEVLGLNDYALVADAPGTNGVCGDGKTDLGEFCDDGNDVSGDGCSECAIEDCYTCSNQVGKPSNCTVAAAGTACSNTRVCDGKGGCVQCLNDTQCLGGYCYQNVCLRCDDGIQNGDESDIDCGGTDCGKCDLAKTCSNGGDCNSGFCTDGVCCAEACDQVCLACNVTGSEGLCEFIAQFDEDPSYGVGQACAAAEGEACNGGGTCGKALGEICTGPAQCASIACGDPDGDGTKTCVKMTGESCTENVECFSNMCSAGMCL